MILVKEKLGNIYTAFSLNCEIDILPVEWYEKRKRILHKQTKNGGQVSLKFLNKNPDLADGDILYADEKKIIAVEIQPCKCIIISLENSLKAASISYEIGNRHLSLFYEVNDLLLPYDVQMHNLLQALGYIIKIEERKLNKSFHTTVLPHLQVGVSGSLANKTNKLSIIS